MDDILKSLIRARDLIKKGWTKGPYARNAKGAAVPYDSRTAVKFCALGAIYRACRGTSLSYLTRLEVEKGNLRPWYNITGFNESSKTRKRDILRVFNEAIERMGGKA